jgi:hypothetical protein
LRGGSSIAEEPLLSSHLSQSSPKSSIGCCVRIVPFPQRRSSAEQYLSHPQQIRSGCLGLTAIFGFVTVIGGYPFKGSRLLVKVSIRLTAKRVTAVISVRAETGSHNHAERTNS